MLSYLNELNRDVNADKLNDRMIQEDAKAIAWECLKGTYRPATAKRKDAIALLNGDDAEARLKYLEHRLRLIQTIGPAQDQIRFALDPLAEYLAALQLIENYGKNQGQWRKFLTQAATMPGAPAAIQGFLPTFRPQTVTRGCERSNRGKRKRGKSHKEEKISFLKPKYSDKAYKFLFFR